MALIFNIKCKSPEDMNEFKNKIIDALKFSYGYCRGEISIEPLQDDAFTLIIGGNTPSATVDTDSSSLELDVHSLNLLER